MKRIALLSLLLCTVSTAAAWAGGVSVADSRVLDRWTLRIGGYLTGLDTDLRLDSPINGVEGTEINLEDDLGFSSSESVPRVRLSVILGKRHEIGAGWYEADRDSSTTITEEIRWGDEVFPVDAEVGAFYRTEFLDVSYTYWFYSSERTALGITGGLVVANVAAGIGVELVGQEIQLQDDISTDVPVPQLGFSVRSYLGSRFVLSGTLGYVALEIEDYSGNVGTAALALEHRTFKNFGFGVGYVYSNYDVEADSRDFIGQLQYTIDGFEIYGRAAW